MNTIEHKGFTITIQQDTGASDPRKEFDHFGTMVCWWNRYNLGDENPRMSPQEWIRDFAAGLVCASDPDAIPQEHIDRILEKHAVMLPLYVYEHGGITMSTGRFSCPWDSGQAGWIYTTREQVQTEFCGDVQAAERCLRGEVEEYDSFLTGDVWGFTVEDTDGEEIESCWGFYGYDYCEQEARAVVDSIALAVV